MNWLLLIWGFVVAAGKFVGWVVIGIVLVVVMCIFFLVSLYSVSMAGEFFVRKLKQIVGFVKK